MSDSNDVLSVRTDNDDIETTSSVVESTRHHTDQSTHSYSLITTLTQCAAQLITSCTVAQLCVNSSWPSQ